MKMTAKQIAHTLNISIKEWMTFEKSDGKTVQKIDASKVGLRATAMDQAAYLEKLTVFCKLTGLTLASDITKGGLYYWVAVDKAAFDAVGLEVLNLPVTVLKPTSKPSKPIVDEDEESDVVLLDNDEDSDDEDEDSDDEDSDDDEDEDGEGATA